MFIFSRYLTATVSGLMVAVDLGTPLHMHCMVVQRHNYLELLPPLLPHSTEHIDYNWQP